MSDVTQQQIDSMSRIFGKIGMYDGDKLSEDIMHALGFKKRRKKMIVVFCKIAESAQTAFKDSRGHLICESGDRIIRRDTGNDLFDQWSVDAAIFDSTYTILRAHSAKNAQEAQWMQDGWLPCYKSAWQWMRLIVPNSSKSHLIIPTLEKAEEPFKLNSWGWLSVGVKGEMWIVPWETGRDQYEDVTE